jgi:hypothetical protein
MIRAKDETNSAIACTVEASNLKVTLAPRETDIVFGRGTKYHDHAGNKRMRACIKEYKQLYLVVKRLQKYSLVEMIYEKLLEGGARFLRRDNATDAWVLVDRVQATKKVSHALRYKEHLNRSPRSTNVEKKSDAILTVVSQSKTAAVKTKVNESLSRSTVAPTLQAARMPPFGPLAAGNSMSYPASNRTILAPDSLRLQDMVRHQQLLAMLEMERQVQDQAALLKMERQVQDQAASALYDAALNQYLGLRK